MMKLEVPPTRMMFGDRSFAVDEPHVWNSLPASFRDPTLSITVFSNRLNSCCDRTYAYLDVLTNMAILGASCCL